MPHLPYRASLKGLFFVVLGLLVSNTWAHTGGLSDVHAHTSALASLMAGIAHPLTGIDHLTAMMAVGVWGALTSRPGSVDWLKAPAVFACMLMVGALAGLLGVALPSVEPMLAVSVLVMGLLVFARAQIGTTFTAILVGTFALFHGVAHGAELANMPYSVLILAGVFGATVLLHVLGLVVGWNLRASSVWLTRAAGAAVVGLGAQLLLALA